MQQDDSNSAVDTAFRLAPYYEHLVLLYCRPLTAFATRLTGRVEDAEDIVQEALIRAYYALERYPAARIQTLHVRPWLYKITWNTYCTYTGRAKTFALVSLEALDDAPLAPEEREAEQPEQIVEALERRQEVEALVASLPPRYRELITLYYLEELSQQEMAEILNQPVGTVRVALHRGIRLLRKRMGLPLKGGA